MPNNSLGLSREQLRAFLPDHQSVRAFEQIFTSIQETTPDGIEAATNIANSALALAAAAISQLAEVVESLDQALMAPSVVLSEEEENMVPALQLGTIAPQNSDEVEISGGAIDGTPIGATSPNSGAFTTLSSTGATAFGGTPTNNPVLARGPNAGVFGGASYLVLNNGVTIVGIGNKSSVIGGAYDASPYIYANAEPEFNQIPRVPGGGYLLRTMSGLSNGAGAAAGTLTNAPSAGNPTKWIPINDNGTIRYCPAW